MAYASSNPWDVPQIDSFNFLCCPECVYRSKEESTFQVNLLRNSKCPNIMKILMPLLGTLASGIDVGRPYVY